ncbi:hypothetical protein L195_g034424 [Trifolium pratense]|uniref:Uncharacterized protein n=1 Tax=Trifolium pratense TaxID=57577 RepID=A0A2K3LIU5_TRIPR|nr:hypothetical protein L195_g034424 [Trifolium pratense]
MQESSQDNYAGGVMGHAQRNSCTRETKNLLLLRAAWGPVHARRNTWTREGSSLSSSRAA